MYQNCSLHLWLRINIDTFSPFCKGLHYNIDTFQRGWGEPKHIKRPPIDYSVQR